jgi:hypothetical protein
MTQYYFLAASLPHLSYDMDKFFSIDQFLETCESSLTVGDFCLLKKASYNDLDEINIKNKILNSWFIWEIHLRNKLVNLRAKKRNENADVYVRRNSSLSIDDKFIQQAFEDESPLEAENILDKERWIFLESMELGHYFDIIKLIVYYLKLQILWRRKYINNERGSKEYNDIINSFQFEDISFGKANMQ